MAAFVLRPLKSFYHEFGLSSVRETGLDAYLIIIARSCRMFAYGTNALVLGTSQLRDESTSIAFIGTLRRTWTDLY